MSSPSPPSSPTDNIPTHNPSPLSDTTLQLFGLWCEACRHEESNNNNKNKDWGAAARSFFQSLSQQTQLPLPSGTVLQTKGSQEQALAVLIQSMSPIWKSTGDADTDVATENNNNDDATEAKDNTTPPVKGLVARKRALSCIAGALEGSLQSAPATPMSAGLFQSLSSFLITVAGPVQLDDDDDDDDNDPDSDDLDEQLRDIALTTLQQLLKFPLPPPPPEHDTLGIPRLVVAQSAVQQRCAVPEFGQDAHHPISLGRVRSGIATLPRSRRSQCFVTLAAALQPLTLANRRRRPPQPPTDAVSIETVEHYVTFCASCLHGESDPRCLLQIVQLLAQVQQTLGPIFTDYPFPASDVFDAVAPYYPIQFTPPPNDVHGITREALCRALSQVLTYTANDAVLQRKGHDTMLSLSLGLFLDTLNPPPEDGPPTLQDQEEALTDICQVLLGVPPTLSSSSPRSMDDSWGTTDRLGLVEPATLRQVVQTVWATHGQASTKLSSSSHNTTYRTLTYQCRALVSLLALTTERAATTTPAAVTRFDVVVTERIRSLSSTTLHPNDLAYLACVASAGGVQCLQLVLQRGLVPMVERLVKDNKDRSSTTATTTDNDKTQETTCDSVAALLAACQAGCERIQRRGVTLSPHPLAAVALPCFTVLHDILVSRHWPSAARAWENLVSATPVRVWNDVNVLLDPVMEIVQVLLQPILRTTSDMEVDQPKKLIDCCISTAARIFALAEEESSERAKLLLAQEPIQAAIREKLVALVDSCASAGTAGERYDCRCLGEACRISESVAQLATSRCLTQCMDDINAGSNDTALVSEALSGIIAMGGKNVSLELQKVSEGPSILRLISVLTGSNDNGAVSGVPGHFGVSTLRLPPTEEETNVLKEKVSAVYRMVLPIIPDYSRGVLPSHRKDILVELEKVLPPFSEAETVRLSALLPLASKVLQYSDEIETDEKSTWIALKTYLANVALGEEPLETKKFAAEALHGVLCLVDTEELQCPILHLLDDVVLPELQSLKIKIEEREKSNRNATIERQKLVETVAFAGLVGSAATLRGSSSAETSRLVSDFLIDLSTGLTSTFENGMKPPFSFPAGDGDSGFWTLVAADAFGSMLGSAGNQTISGQRLRYFATKHFRDTVTSIRTLSSGMVLVAAYLCCSVDLISQDSETVKLFFEIILGGLKRIGSKGFGIPGASRKVALAALIKIQSLRADIAEPFLYPVVTGALRAYATLSVADTQEDVIAGKILSLQVLEAAATMTASKEVLHQLKDAVITILSAALNEKSSLLRHAAVDVLNAWHVL